MYARDTNDRPHPWAVCPVGRETLVAGGWLRQKPPIAEAASAAAAGVLDEHSEYRAGETDSLRGV